MKRIVLFVALTVAAPVALCGTVLSHGTYKFGIRERDYPAYFPPASNLNAVMKRDEAHSWLTKLPVGSTWIEVEHGVLASDEDLGRLRLANGKYLFVSVRVESAAVTSIKMENRYDGAPLETVGTFLFRTHHLANGKPDPARPAWDVVELQGNRLAERYPFGFVRIYKVPEAARVQPFIPQVLWFGESMQQRLELELSEGGSSSVHVFELESHWHQADSVWWRILTVT